MDFSPSELTRYSRHLILPEVGREGQLKLKAAKVLVVGAGGLGCPVSIYLAAAGVGTIGLVDFDAVDGSNLQRQILYAASDVGKKKAERAQERLAELNPEIEVRAHLLKLSAENAKAIIRDYDLVIDGTDNFATRFLINDACVMLKKPNVYGSIFRFEGQVSVFDPPHGPCYRCMFPNMPPPDAVPNCAEGGVLGVLAGTIGALQATEAIKYILRVGESLVGRLLIYDAIAMYFDVLNIRRNPDCAVCGDKPTITSLKDETFVCATNQQVGELTPSEAQKLLAANSNARLLDVRTPQEYELCNINKALHIPLNELPDRLSELPRETEWIVYCKSGMRSARACELLASSGFRHLHNLTGGIVRWSQEVDKSLAVY